MSDCIASVRLRSADAQLREALAAVLVERIAGLDKEVKEDLPAVLREAGECESRQERQTIRRLREQKGWTQQELAQKSGLPQSHISKLETGLHSPSNRTLVTLAKALEVEPAEIDPAE
jgi:ribosome-binding protein aMBF1 (putative translation factor)